MCHWKENKFCEKVFLVEILNAEQILHGFSKAFFAHPSVSSSIYDIMITLHLHTPQNTL